MKDLIISHGADIDGVSPIILYKFCNRPFEYHLIEIYELEETILNLIEENKEYEHIYIVDLTISESVYEILENSKYKEKIKVFDHHQTHLYASKKRYVTIDTSQCATMIFYYFLKNQGYMNKEIIYDYVTHVNHLDLWLWEEKKDFLAKQLGDLLGIYGKDMYIDEMYQKLEKDSIFQLNEFEDKILFLENEKIKRYLLKKEKEMYFIKIDSYQIGVVYAEQYRSELGNYLSIQHPEIDFVAILNIAGGISFRTCKEVDLSSFASKYDGGGHKQAAGAPFPKKLKQEIIETIFEGCEFIER